MSNDNPEQENESPATLEEESPDSVSLNRLMVAGGVVGLGLTVILLVFLTSGGGGSSENPNEATPQAQQAPTNPQGQTFLSDEAPEAENPPDTQRDTDTESSYEPSGGFGASQGPNYQSNQATTMPQQTQSRRGYQAYRGGRASRGGGQSPAQPSPEEQRFQAARSSDLLVISESSGSSGGPSTQATSQPPSGGAQSSASGWPEAAVSDRTVSRLRATRTGRRGQGRNAVSDNARGTPVQDLPPSATPPISGQGRSPSRGQAPAAGVAQQRETGNRQFQRRVAARSQESPYYRARVTRPRSRYEIDAGSMVPAVLMTAISSELPGSVVAQVSRNVYDSQSQNHLLIPKGSRLIGEYNDQIALGQSRIMVAWTRIIFPDGRSMQLPGLNAKGRGGAQGLSDEVNRHYMRVFGSAVALSAIGAGFQLSQPDQGGGGFGGYQSRSPQQVLAAELGRELSRVATEMIRRNMQIEPTVKIRKGFRFYVFLNKDLAFPAPYRAPENAPRFERPTGLAVTSPHITPRRPARDTIPVDPGRLARDTTRTPSR